MFKLRVGRDRVSDDNKLFPPPRKKITPAVNSGVIYNYNTSGEPRRFS